MRGHFSTALTDLLGCRLPVVQTAMGWIATPPLVAASSNAGAFGFLAAAVMSPSEVGAAIRVLKGLTSHRFGVNFHSFQPGAKDIVEIIIANTDCVSAVSFGRGADADLIARFRATDIVCIPTVGAVKHAQKMAALGCQALVVQGSEGGGHTGSVATTVLLPQILDAVEIPIVAAGGFADGRGLAAALAYGAAGIAMGSRFMMTRESPVPMAIKQAYRRAGTDDIIVTDKIDGIPQRMIRNAMLERIMREKGWGMRVIAKGRRGLLAGLAMKRNSGVSWRAMLAAAWQMRQQRGTSLSQAMLAAAAPSLLQKAVVAGDAEAGLMAAGLVVGRLDTIPSCVELLEKITDEACMRLAAISDMSLSSSDASSISLSSAERSTIFSSPSSALSSQVKSTKPAKGVV